MMVVNSIKTKIRELRSSESDRLLELYHYLHEQDEPLPPDNVIAGVWKQIRKNKQQKIFGVFAEGHLVSSCVLNIIPNLTRGCKPYGLIENVVTHPDYRRRGMGKALLQHALNYASSWNCYKVMLLTGRKNEAICRFYESAGFDGNTKQAFIAKPGKK